ncbi:MAG: DUF2970 domain-containing protein [Shewanella sp.]
MLSRLWQIFCSTLAAFFGVQSDNQRQRDFRNRSPLPYIIMGILFAVLLVLSLMWIVSQVLN